MYEVFLGNYERVIGQTVYHKIKNAYIPCVVTNYYFKSRMYTLVSVEDMNNIPMENHHKRKLFKTQKIYVIAR